MMDKNLIFLDTETTGLDDEAEIVEIALVDHAGQVVFESYCKPSKAKTDPKAFEVHGICDEALANAPIWTEIEQEIKTLLENKEVVIFNARFDVRLMRQTAEAAGTDVEWIHNLKMVCAMYYAASIFGATNRYGTISLINAALEAGVTFERAAHSAAGDALATRLVYLACKKAEVKRKKAAIYRDKARKKRLALVPDNYHDYPYFGQINRPAGYITLSRLPLKDADKYEYAGTCCSSFGDQGHLFKPRPKPKESS